MAGDGSVKNEGRKHIAGPILACIITQSVYY